MGYLDQGKWAYSADHAQLCKIVDTQDIWGESICTVWLPDRSQVVRVPASRLSDPQGLNPLTADHIIYAATAARISEAQTEDILLAPIESSVTPLPHQIRALETAISGERIRYLLADEVGLGKTIEAGLILRELKLRGRVVRTLVVAPKGLVTQWVSEMRTHFGETFHLILPDDLKTIRRLSGGGANDGAHQDGGGSEPERPDHRNPWCVYPQIVVPMDSVKPMERRRGWTQDRVAEYNRERFEDLISAGWDLVIVDEAHRLGGSTDQVARFRLGQGVAEAAPYLLLLSATPHQGKTEAFHRIVSLLDAEAFPDPTTVSRASVAPYVVRTEKRQAIDSEGKPLFKPRRTELAPVSWETRHRDQKALYKAVSEYVRLGYNRALKEKRSYIGFLLILMQRLVVSSTRAIRTTLERRLEALQVPDEQLSLFPSYLEDEWADLDSQEQLEGLLSSRLSALKDEQKEVSLLLEAATRCEQAGADAKAEALLDWIYRLQAEESDPELKVLLFTEFVPTQQMLRGFLTDRGIPVTWLNGSMGLEERQRAQESFAGDARILISTDAGGEGLNLQFAHVVINYDIPWNPMRLEQRIGRVDRIGQKHAVRAVNFVFQDSVEHRVQEVLEQKLIVILEEFGIDKAGDVLDSAEAGRIFDDLYMDAILDPDHVDVAVEGVVSLIQEQARESRESADVLGEKEPLDPGIAQRLMDHPLPHWVENMTVRYLRAYGGSAEMKGRTWELAWPDGTTYAKAVFRHGDALELPSAFHITLEDARVRALVDNVPSFLPCQPVARASWKNMSAELVGFWSLWSISIMSKDRVARRLLPLFRTDDGRCFAPSARHIWDQLVTGDVEVSEQPNSSPTADVLEELRPLAEEQGKSAYDEILHQHHRSMNELRTKAELSFAARRRVIERIGLPEVRDHRLRELEEEERQRLEDLGQMMETSPDLQPLLVLRIGD
jgi:superfamily II DNA or RNA helicase